VKILIDTHCWLWWQAFPDRLNADSQQLIANTANTILLSAVSAWEIAIKVGLGRLVLPEPLAAYVPSRLVSQGMLALPIEHTHALHVATLPPLHRDPFDRLLVAQAQVEHLPILTADQQLLIYDVETLWAGRSPPRAGRSSIG